MHLKNNKNNCKKKSAKISPAGKKFGILFLQKKIRRCSCGRQKRSNSNTHYNRIVCTDSDCSGRGFCVYPDAYTLKLHGCYKNSIQVTAKIDDIAIDNQSNIQVTYKYTYNGKEYTTQRSSRVTEMKRGDKKEIKISKTDKSEVLPYESEIENILPFAAIDAMLLLLAWVLWLKCVKKK